MATNKINVTNVDFSTSGDIANGSDSTLLAYPAPPNWTRAGVLVYTPNAVIYLGYTNVGGSSYTRIYRCTDKVNYSTWTAIDLPVSANWTYGAYGNNRLVLHGSSPGGGANTTTIYSTDEGATWGTGSAQSTTVAAQTWGSITYGNKFLLPVNGGIYESTNGTSWTILGSGNSPASGTHCLAYNSIIDRWIRQDSNGNLFLSTSNTASAWTNINANIGKQTSNWYAGDIISSGKYFIVGLRSDYPTYLSQIKMSTNGTTWTTINTSIVDTVNSSISSLRAVKDLGNGNILTWCGSRLSLISGTTFTYNICSTIGVTTVGDNMGTNNLQTYNSNPNYLISVSSWNFDLYKIPISVGKLVSDRYIDVTASKTGATPVTKRLFIKKTQQTTPTYVLYCNPGSFNLMSTLDGVVDPAAFTNATTTLIVTKDGIDQTGWTFSTDNDTGLGASITGGVLSITSLTNSVDLAYANISAAKTGEPGLLLKVAITKNKTGVVSGINRGSSLSSIITNSNTILSIKFLNTGMVQIKYGNGSYSNLIPWINPVDTVSPPGGSWWMHMITTGDAFTTSAGSGWLQLNTSREFIFDKTGSPSGTYTCNMTVQFGTTSTGGNISAATGSLQVIIP